MRTNNSFTDAEVREAIAAAIKELEEKEKQEIKEVRKIYKPIDKIIKKELIKEIQAIGDNINKEINSVEYWRNAEFQLKFQKSRLRKIKEGDATMFEKWEIETILSFFKNKTKKAVAVFLFHFLGIKIEDITNFNGYTTIEILDAADNCHGDFSVYMIFDDNGDYMKTEVYEN